MSVSPPNNGTPMVPVVPAGDSTSMPKRCSLASCPQFTTIGPYGVGVCPSTQARLPGCGLTDQVWYPAATGRMPRTNADSAEVAPEDQPCARLVNAPNPGVPSVARASQSAPLKFGPR